ncbi:MAG: alpha/beta hydrolase [Hyphomonas sp.]|nr:alpha/beta hydrolase [Hyphomonas sp.]
MSGSPFTLEYIVDGNPVGRPLVLLNSLEYPGWPPAEFCRFAGERGFCVYAIRRPGFGNNVPLADAAHQADIVEAFLEREMLHGAVVVCTGTSNPVGFRLAFETSAISLLVFSCCMFNYDAMADIRPDWLARSLRQALTSDTGARLTLMGLDSSWAVFSPRWVHENLAKGSAGDLDYIRANDALLLEALEDLYYNLEPPTFQFELAQTLNPDPVLEDGLFRNVRALAFSGIETPPSWQDGIGAETGRLGLPLVFLPSGDYFAMYQSAGAFLDGIQGHLP